MQHFTYAKNELAARDRATLRMEANKKLAQAREARLARSQEKAEAAARRKAERAAAAAKTAAAAEAKQSKENRHDAVVFVGQPAGCLAARPCGQNRHRHHAAGGAGAGSGHLVFVLAVWLAVVSGVGADPGLLLPGLRRCACG